MLKVDCACNGAAERIMIIIVIMMTILFYRDHDPDYTLTTIVIIITMCYNRDHNHDYINYRNDHHYIDDHGLYLKCIVDLIKMI